MGVLHWREEREPLLPEHPPPSSVAFVRAMDASSSLRGEKCDSR